MNNGTSEYRYMLEMFIGDECLICGSKEKLYFHEIHDVRHPTTFKYYIAHLKDFIPLCSRHHQKMHSILYRLEHYPESTKSLRIISLIAEAISVKSCD